MEVLKDTYEEIQQYDLDDKSKGLLLEWAEKIVRWLSL